MDLVQGDTDSERLFALITTEVDNHDGDIEAGITAAISWVAATLPLLSLNFVMIEADELWALRYPDVHELHLLERPAGEPLHHVSSHGTRIHSDDAAERDTVVVATELLDQDPGWRALSSGELVHVTPALEVLRRTVVNEPPAHLLNLARARGAGPRLAGLSSLDARRPDGAPARLDPRCRRRHPQVVALGHSAAEPQQLVLLALVLDPLDDHAHPERLSERDDAFEQLLRDRVAGDPVA